MRARSYTPCNAWRIALIAAALTVGACDAVNDAIDAIDDIGNDADVHYYVSLGTSLSVGVQPNGSGVALPTDEGYADQLFDSIRPAFEAAGAQPRELRLTRLGCPGETLDDMMNGGSCPYLAGSQLAAAVDFLTDNAGRIHLVTIDIGGNDFRNGYDDCVGTADPIGCADTLSVQIAANLAPVLTELRNAAGPDTTVIGMNYYNPYLSSWLEGDAGIALAAQSMVAVANVSGYLDATYLAAGIPLADVASAFQSNDETLVTSMLPPPNDAGLLPLNVMNICLFTYQCDPDPRGPDIHANTAGYSLIAATIEAILP